MKNNLLVLLSLFVVASIVLAACGETQEEPASLILQGATPEPNLRPTEGYDAVVQFSIIYSEGMPGTKSHSASTWLDSYWFMNEVSGDTPAVAPSLFSVHLKKGNSEQYVDVAPGANSTVLNGRPDEYKILGISTMGWTCDRRADQDVWDCKFNK